MKICSKTSKSKKKRKETPSPRGSANNKPSYTPPSRNLRSRRRHKKNSCFKKNINNDLHGIKCMVKSANEENLSKIVKKVRAVKLKDDNLVNKNKEQINNKSAKRFLKRRSFNMANEPSNSVKPVSNITFEHLLNIHKKRLKRRNKNQASLETMCQPEFVSKERTIEVEQVIERKEMVEDDSVIEIITEQDNIPELRDENVNLELITIEDSLMESPVEINDEKSEVSKEVEWLDDGDKSVIFTSSSGVPRGILSCDSEKSDNPEQPAKVSDNNSIIVIPSEAEIDENENPKDIGYVDKVDPSFIITSNSCLPRLFTEKIVDREVAKASSNSTIITIPDTPEELNDSDIIFVSEKRDPSCIVNSKKRKLTQTSIIVVDDDDDDCIKVKRRQTLKSLRLSTLVKNKKRKKKRKLKHRKKGTILESSSATMTTGKSESASCADTNCINAPNTCKVSRESVQACGCQLSRAISNPNLEVIPEESATPNYVHNGIDMSATQILPFKNISYDLFTNNTHNAVSTIGEGLREIIIDGSNVAVGHSNGRWFSVKGLQIAIDYFVRRKHKVTAFVPQYRVKHGQCSDPGLLQKLADLRLVIFTPSREVDRKRITPYDDRYIIQYATTCKGIVVSNDNFRDLLHEKPEWRETIEQRILMHTWVDDMLMFPDDPLGRCGPHLSRFLRFP